MGVQASSMVLWTDILMGNQECGCSPDLPEIGKQCQLENGPTEPVDKQGCWDPNQFG